MGRDSEDRDRGSALAQPIDPAPIPSTATTRDVVEAFRTFPGSRFLAVVDQNGRPVGAVEEQRVRELLFSPFGHSLLSNPGCTWALNDFIRPYPTAEAALDVEGLVTAFTAMTGAEGLILTRRGSYAGLLPSQTLLQMAAERDRQEQSRRLAEAEAALARGAALEAAFAAFRTDVASFGVLLGQTADEIQRNAEGVADRAERNSRQAADIAMASSQTANGVAEAAAQSSQLAQKGRDMLLHLDEVRGAVQLAVGHVNGSAARGASLAAVAQEIGEMTTLIFGMTKRVNVLAINATIEAARAGPAGRAFAVVAGEVKSHARQAAEAAASIEGRIGAIRKTLAEAAASNAEIERIVHRVEEVALGTIDAIGEQAGATALIADNVEQAALASAQITRHVGDMQQRTESAGAMASRLSEVAELLNMQAAGLADRVERLLEDVRRA